jgi:hypothetical protein
MACPVGLIGRNSHEEIPDHSIIRMDPKWPDQQVSFAHKAREELEVPYVVKHEQSQQGYQPMMAKITF